MFFRILGRGQSRDSVASKENAQFASFGTTEYLKPCNYDAKHDHLKIVPIIATSFDPGLRPRPHEDDYKRKR